LFSSTTAQGIRLQEIQKNTQSSSEVLAEILKGTAKRTGVPFVCLELRTDALSAILDSAFPAENFLSLVLAAAALEVNYNGSQYLSTRQSTDPFLLHLHASSIAIPSQPKVNADLLICSKSSIIEAWPALCTALRTAGPQDT
jgi:hypothetical protein